MDLTDQFDLMELAALVIAMRDDRIGIILKSYWGYEFKGVALDTTIREGQAITWQKTTVYCFLITGQIYYFTSAPDYKNDPHFQQAIARTKAHHEEA